MKKTLIRTLACIAGAAIIAALGRACNKDNQSTIPSQQQNISKITSNKYWTNFMNPGGGSGCFPTIFTNSSQKNPYCKFSIKSGFDFIYEYKDIPKTATVSDIFNAIMTDMYRIIAAI